MPNLRSSKLRLHRDTVRSLVVSHPATGRAVYAISTAVCPPSRDCDVTFTCTRPTL